MQFAAEALLFAIGDLKDLPLQQLLSPDVAGLGHDPRSGVADHLFTNNKCISTKTGSLLSRKIVIVNAEK